MTTRFLVDNSVIQRLGKPVIRQAWDELVDQGVISTCLPVMLEVGYSARSAREHTQLLALERLAKVVLPPTPEVLTFALQIQANLFAAGKGRSAGISDIQIAATALHHSTPTDQVVVVHYDADFEHIKSVTPEFALQWIVPRGTVD